MSQKVFEMVKLDKYPKRKINTNIILMKEVDYVIYYPYRSVRVMDTFMSISRDTDVGNELYYGLLKLFHTDGDNHHAYGLFDVNGKPIMYIWFEDNDILFGRTISYN